MKLSLRWIFDHIQADRNDHDHAAIVAQFNKKTAEIEHVYPISFDLSLFALGQIAEQTPDTFIVTLPEGGQQISLKPRTDTTTKDGAYLVNTREARWATLADFGMEKDGLIPAMKATQEELAGEWRTVFEADDIILDVDNKSVTHRPDMWGHRGFAREIAAFIHKNIVPAQQLLADIPRKKHDASRATSGVFTADNNAPSVCPTITTLHLPSVENHPSDIRMVSRFLKIGYRPINALIDATNYAMADWGHPMHAYDADCLADKKITVRMACSGETVALLDGKELALTAADVVIDHAGRPTALAGIMGGLHDSVSDKTSALFLEAACFDAATIRRSSARHKVRTESSQRFEKTLDPDTAPEAILRYCALLEKIGTAFTANAYLSIADAPNRVSNKAVITVSHQFISSRIGVTLSSDQVIDILTRLEFTVVHEQGIYTLTVPSFRATKDIKIKEDIVEEIARFYGFDNITPVIPPVAHTPSDLSPTVTLRRAVDYLALGARMLEQRNYAFYDEKFLAHIGWQESDKLTVRNPVSEDAYRLVSSLVPHLLKNIQSNNADHDHLEFFEYNRVWGPAFCQSDSDTECNSFAGVFYHKRVPFDFYQLKSKLAPLFALYNASVTWQKLTPAFGERPQWLHKYYCAALYCNDQLLGYFGQVDPLIVQKIGGLPESQIFAFECNADMLASQPQRKIKVQPTSKYQGSSFDISITVPLSSTVTSFQEKFAQVNDQISTVRLIDFFEKKEWLDKRSLAFRIELANREGTLTKEEIEKIRSAVIVAAQELGGVLR